jgi:hypothetical protein
LADEYRAIAKSANQYRGADETDGEIGDAKLRRLLIGHKPLLTHSQNAGAQK